MHSKVLAQQGLAPGASSAMPGRGANRRRRGKFPPQLGSRRAGQQATRTAARRGEVQLPDRSPRYTAPRPSPRRGGISQVVGGRNPWRRRAGMPGKYTSRRARDVAFSSSQAGRWAIRTRPDLKSWIGTFGARPAAGGANMRRRADSPHADRATLEGLRLRGVLSMFQIRGGWPTASTGHLRRGNHQVARPLLRRRLKPSRRASRGDHPQSASRGS